MPVVVDASATLAWLFGEDDPCGWIESHLQSDGLIAPSLWQLEVVHAILKKERQHHLTSDQAAAFLNVLDTLSIEIVPPRNQTLQDLAAFARPHQLSAYDAIYLDLALQRKVAILTLDHNLQDAARRLKIGLIE